jgi:catechol 2,3-dioxygenase-like lactoylglutathione lyase family enzyme
LPVLDHLILSVNDREQSLRFYTDVLGFEDEGERGPFVRVRAGADCVILLAPFGTEGNSHLAFSLTKAEFDTAFDRIRNAGVAYGDAFDQATNMSGPGAADGAHGDTQSLYLLDPNRHLIELLYYENPSDTLTTRVRQGDSQDV